tara:strand:+ start:168 stop:548 length:381 start_codon:yes stop_codon:yes gene_type:complete
MTRKSKFNVRRSTTVKNDHLTSDKAWYKNAKTFAKDSEKEVKRTKEKWSKGYYKFSVADDPARRNAKQQALRREGIEVEVQNSSVIKQRGYEIDLNDSRFCTPLLGKNSKRNHLKLIKEINSSKKK